MTGRIERHRGRLMVVVEIYLTTQPKKLVRGFPVIRGAVEQGDTVQLDDVSREWVRRHPITGAPIVVNVIDSSTVLRKEDVLPPRKAPRNQEWVWRGEWKLRRIA